MAPHPLLLKSRRRPFWQVTEERKMALFSQGPKESGCQPQWVAGMALGGRTPVFQVSWHPRRAVCFQAFAHSHPAPHCPALIKVAVAPRFASWVFKTQHLVKTCTQLSRTFEPWPMFLKDLISFWFTSNACINSTWWCICCLFPSTNWYPSFLILELRKFTVIVASLLFSYCCFLELVRNKIILRKDFASKSSWYGAF